MDKWERIAAEVQTTWLICNILDVFKRHHLKHIKSKVDFQL